MQRDTASRRELCCLSMWDRLTLAAERIDPSEYRDVALALVAMDVAVGQVKRLGLAILVVRGEECQRHFMGEYADLVWESIREQVTSERRQVAWGERERACGAGYWPLAGTGQAACGVPVLS